jgi:hypothetical protein
VANGRASYGSLLDLAETACLDHDETRGSGFSRYHQHSGKQDIEGFIGQAWYSGEDLRPLLPALWLGQWRLYIGKSYVVGSGRYELALMGADGAVESAADDQRHARALLTR